MENKSFIRTDSSLLPGPAERRFLELVMGIEIIEEEPKDFNFAECLYFFKNEFCIFKLKWDFLQVNKEFWDIFCDEFGFNFFELRSFLISMMEKHFNLKNVRPLWTTDINLIK